MRYNEDGDERNLSGRIGQFAPREIPNYLNTMATTTMVSLAASYDSVIPFRTPRVMTSAIACSMAVKRHNSAPFAALPEEIKIEILEWCDFRGVHSCQLVRGGPFTT